MICMKHYYLLLAAGLLLFTLSCGEKKKPAFYDNDISSAVDLQEGDNDNSNDYAQMVDANIISVPFTEKNGVKFVNVSVNGIGLEMIFDTGCSGTLISVAEANYLYQKGCLKPDDFLGTSKSQIADGSIVEDMIILLKEVVIDGRIVCPDVTATVSANSNAPLLLGNEVLNRVAAYAIDNENKTINFKLK